MGNIQYKKVITFTDLEVYQRLYRLTLDIHKKILPKLPKSEQFSLKDQLSRSSKSPCALIAEAYARRTSGKEWRKYMREAIGECNESIVHLSLIRDLYSDKVEVDVCNLYIEEYNIAGKQLFKLGESWK